MGNDQVPLRNMMVFAVLSPKLGTAFQIGGHIAVNMPFRMATPATFLDITGVGLMTQITEGLTFRLGFFASYQHIKMSHFLHVVVGRYN